MNNSGKYHFLKMHDERILLHLECEKCGACIREGFSFSNKRFFDCIKGAIQEQSEIHEIYIKGKKSLYRGEIEILSDFFKSSSSISHLLKTIIANGNKKCPRTTSICMIYDFLKKYHITGNGTDYDIAMEFWQIHAFFEQLERFLMNNEYCLKCIRIKSNQIQNVVENIEEMHIFQKIPKQKHEIEKLDSSILNTLLKSKLIIRETNLAKENELTLVDRYKVTKSSLVEALIYKDEESFEFIYKINVKLPFSSDFFLFLKTEITEALLQEEVFLELEKFNALLEKIGTICEEKLEIYFHTDDFVLKRDIGNLLAFSIMKMDKLFPLLIDEKINEIFLDSLDGCLYLHQSQYTNCKTSITLQKEEVNSIISRLRFETNKNLNQLHPNLSCVISNHLFYVRIGIDLFPLNFHGFSLDIRKLNKQIFNILDLIKLNSLDIEIATFLIFCIQSKRNLTIVGKTDSGKTTLMNTLDKLYPDYFRKIYIENMVESIEQEKTIYHQLKLQVRDPKKKSTIIANILHRSPDILILGELLTREESNAFFHCLSIGLTGMQTIHANSAASFVRRILYHHGINSSCLEDLDFLVIMKKFENGQRKIIEVDEVEIKPDLSWQVNPIFSYNPDMGKWQKNGDSRKISCFLENSFFNHDKYHEYLCKIRNNLQSTMKSEDYEDLPRLLNQLYIQHLDYF